MSATEKFKVFDQKKRRVISRNLTDVEAQREAGQLEWDAFASEVHKMHKRGVGEYCDFMPSPTQTSWRRFVVVLDSFDTRRLPIE